MKNIIIMAAVHHYPAQTLLGGVIFLAVLIGLLALIGFFALRSEG